MVLAGGPDRERQVSLMSGAEVTSGLRQAGHEVMHRDIGPSDLSALEAFEAWTGDVIFPALHGSWGEGGGLQRILDERGLPYVGCSTVAADLCMDKHLSKLAFEAHGLPTPPSQIIGVGEAPTMPAPIVIKPLREGSSIDVMICYDAEGARRAHTAVAKRYDRLLVEKYIHGMELTVGILGDEALPPIHIISSTDFYDYEAKYKREDTQYRFDIELPQSVLEQVSALALKAHRVLGCRHLSRVDIIVDDDSQPWVLEVNTIPGFTSHSLVPKAAARAGIAWPQLVDRLARMAMAP